MLLIYFPDYSLGTTSQFGLKPTIGSQGRLSFLRNVALDMASDFFHSNFGRCHLADCWRYAFEHDRNLRHLEDLPLLECLPSLQHLYLDFSNLMFNEQEVIAVSLQLPGVPIYH